MNAIASLANEVGIRTACNALDVSRAGFYRWKVPVTEKTVRPAPPLALSSAERSEVLDVLHEDRFIDKAPQEIYATLLDEKKYICSIRTMYRILEKEGETEREKKSTGPSSLYKTGASCTSPQ